MMKRHFSKHVHEVFADATAPEAASDEVRFELSITNLGYCTALVSCNSHPQAFTIIIIERLSSAVKHFYMVPDLPWEIILAIIRKVSDRSTLLSLCLTTKAVYREASHCIYCDLRDDLDRDASRHLMRINTLIANPQLASLVRSYTIESVASSWRYDLGESDMEQESGFEGHSTTKKKKADPRSTIWDLLPQVFNLMFNLEYLCFREFSGQPSAYWLLPEVKFQLKKMDWGSHGEGEEMAEFLSTQRRLESLYLEEGPSCPLDPGACTALRSLRGNLSTFERFLPGRARITDLDWIPSLDEWEGDPKMEVLLPELHRITHFSIGGYFMRYKLMSFGGYFRDLVAMEIHHIYEAEFSVIFSIPKLQTLVISSPFGGTVLPNPDAAALRLFKGTPSLQTLFTSLEKVAMTEVAWNRRCQLWNRSQIPTPVTVFYQKNTWPTLRDYCSTEHGKLYVGQ